MSHIKAQSSSLAKAIRELDTAIAQKSVQCEALSAELRAHSVERRKLTEALSCLAGVSRDPDTLEACAQVNAAPVKHYY